MARIVLQTKCEKQHCPRKKVEKGQTIDFLLELLSNGAGFLEKLPNRGVNGETSGFMKLLWLEVLTNYDVDDLIPAMKLARISIYDFPPAETPRKAIAVSCQTTGATC